MISKFKEYVNNFNIHKVCRKWGIKNYTINSDGSIDVEGDIDLQSRKLNKIPINFRNVSGNFYCHDNNLTSLEGSPEKVEGTFMCHRNQLKNLKGAPFFIKSNFYCFDNKLNNLEGFPERIFGRCEFMRNNIFSLNGLEFKTFTRIDLYENPIYYVIRDWINNENKLDLIEYFVDLSVIQGNKLSLMRLEAFYEDMDLGDYKDFLYSNYGGEHQKSGYENEIIENIEMIKKYYTIVE
jgi:hypothetical protein